MTVDRRTALVRRAAYVLAGLGLAIIVLAATQPAAFGLTASEALALGLPPLALNVAVVWYAGRGLDGVQLRRLAFAQALTGAAAAGMSVPLATGQTAPTLIALSLIFVYSGLVLETRPHVTVCVVGLGTALLTAALAGLWSTLMAGPVLVLVGAALLTTIGTRFQALELLDRTRATEEAERAARALSAAMVGIQGSATTDSRRILESVTTAAGHLVDGPASLWVLGDDGLLRAGATHNLPAELAERVFRPDEGMAGQVMQARATVILHADEAEGLDTNHQALGLRSTIGTPIRIQGNIEGALLAGRHGDTDWTVEEVNAYTLLAEHAGRALEVSREAAADRRTAARLAELDRIKDEVVATVSHELRTPVTVIAGIAETLTTHPDLDDDVRQDATRRLWANALTLRQILEQLLDATLMQNGELVPRPVPVAVRRLVDDTLARLTPLLHRHPVTVEVDPALAVLADPALLKRVLDNLLVNAVRHTPAGTTVHIGASRRATSVQVTITDDGPGLDPADIPLVLERFGRAGNLNERPRGLGIGLSLADEILRAHGSVLEVISQRGHGAAFSFVLPTPTRADLRTVDPARRSLTR